jgi:hypothetical protein
MTIHEELEPFKFLPLKSGQALAGLGFWASPILMLQL